MFSFKLFALIALFTLAYASCPGCPEKQDSNLPEVKKHLEHIVKKEMDSNVLFNVVSVTTQVVAGIKYTVEFETEDPNTHVKNECKVVYVVQSWITELPNVLNLTCNKM
ncbi:uncharacterized protein LOC106666191 [Cimex lectularius]|uniref:Cystatin domain-containing protein n=1 Tax=Cimex lectularius TaxID=79782 RepID=A0A8I6RLU6_CIMLE|nr:uncharacterized protein LOC106666191 [Cimex lectularius]